MCFPYEFLYSLHSPQCLVGIWTITYTQVCLYKLRVALQSSRPLSIPTLDLYQRLPVWASKKFTCGHNARLCALLSNLVPSSSAGSSPSYWPAELRSGSGGLSCWVLLEALRRQQRVNTCQVAPATSHYPPGPRKHNNFGENIDIWAKWDKHKHAPWPKILGLLHPYSP